MSTLAEKCKEAGLKSAAELTRISGTSKETLTNWMNDKKNLFEVVLRGATISISAYEKLKHWSSYSDVSINEYIESYMPKHMEKERELKFKIRDLEENLPEQTWCFSPEEMQEQTKLIEKLTTENQRLNAELQIAKRKQENKNDETTDTLKEKISLLESKFNHAEYEKEEISKSRHSQLKKSRKLELEKEYMEGEKEIMKERIDFLLAEIETLKNLKDKRSFISNAKNMKQKMFLETLNK